MYFSDFNCLTKFYRKIYISPYIKGFIGLKIGIIMNEKESELLLKFAQQPWTKYTFTEFKKLTKKKSKSYLESFFKKYVQKQILKKEYIGKTPIYSLNFNQKTNNYAGFLLEKKGWEQKNIPYKDIENLIKKTPTKNFILIITGSYAKNKQTKKSDLDVVLLVENEVDTKKIYAELAHFCEMNIPPIHIYVFKNKEFLEMLLNEEHNYGKEITKNNLILKGGQTYIQIIFEAIKNGFPNQDLS